MTIDDRRISFGNDLPDIPERLLLAHARGEVLFICGAGVSMPAGLPSFKQLVVDVYAKLDSAVHSVLNTDPPYDLSSLTSQQAAEVQRFKQSDFDVVLGMLERRLEKDNTDDSKVRSEICDQIRKLSKNPAELHSSILRLSDRGGATTLITTNFDLLFQLAAKKMRVPVETYSLGGIPRPSRKMNFNGVLHIHGALDKDPKRLSTVVVSDRDFGEYYLRRRVVPDFIYDAARLFNLVLIGYSANDPPMRYLLNAVAADGSRFDDLKERFTFIGMKARNPVELEDWKGRGITPIWYDNKNNHDILRETMSKWSDLSLTNGDPKLIERMLKNIVKDKLPSSPEAAQDLFDHLIRRCDERERTRLMKFISKQGASFDWLNRMTNISGEKSNPVSGYA